MKKLYIGYGLFFYIIFIVLFTFSNFITPLYAETSQGPYYIRTITFDIAGSTQPFALRNVADIKEGEVLVNKEELDQFIKIKTQLLINSRIFETVEIQYSLGNLETNGKIPVDLRIKTIDTWNLIALPYFKYDSSNGLEVSAKVRDYNFLGTMQPLKIDLSYTIDRFALNTQGFNRGTFIIDIDSNYPFIAWNHNWNFDFDHFIGYSNKYGFAYENKTGLSLDLPIQRTTLTISAYQGISVNEENADKYKSKYGDRYQDYWYLSNWLQADWTIPTPIVFSNLGKVLYIPSLQIKENYRPFGDIGEERVGPIGTIAQKLAFGRVDWSDNFRKGLETTLTNTNEYNFYKVSWNKSITAEIIGHYPVWSFFGVSGRILGSYYFDEPDIVGGLPLRGILDSAIQTNYGLYTNLDFSFQVIRFIPSEWFGKHWMRLFNFEQHWIPFVDIAMVQDTLQHRNFSLNDMLVTSGIEIVTFPYFIRSFFIRISFGFDVRTAIRTHTLPDGDYREIYIGLGHHY